MGLSNENKVVSLNFPRPETSLSLGFSVIVAFITEKFIQKTADLILVNIFLKLIFYLMNDFQKFNVLEIPPTSLSSCNKKYAAIPPPARMQTIKHTMKKQHFIEIHFGSFDDFMLSEDRRRVKV